jgi:hypothetical protein
MRVHTGRLLLTPANPLLAVDASHLRNALNAIGFIGDRLLDRDRCLSSNPCFLAGERFLSLLTFAGCSVNLTLEPTPEGDPFTHIRLLGPLPRPILRHGRNSRPPRCPGCRALYHDWAQHLTGLETADIPCPGCGSGHPAWEWDWRDKAGFGRSFVWVEEVFPGEAEPTPALLDTLRILTASPWRCLYIQD